jgi:arylsulfatase
MRFPGSAGHEAETKTMENQKEIQHFLMTTVAALVVVLTVVPAVHAQSQIIHDAEFVRMEKEFGEQWEADDALVREKLAELEARFGKKPNIVYILADDVGYTELGSYGGGKVRGAPTPNLDKMADQGMRFLSFYSEVECSPSRAALTTGRHPIRNGLYNITLPGEVGSGLHPEEVTIAEVLSDAGYYTGHFGKWHMGGEEEHYPTNQGFDEAEWSEGNPPWWVNNREASAADDIGGMTNRALIHSPGPENFPYDTGGVMRGRKGQEPDLVYEYSMEKYNTYDSEAADHVIDFIERRAKTDQPFFVNFWGKGNHFWGAHPDFRDTPAGTNTSAQMVEHDYNTGRILKTLKDLGIAENTLVIWSSDNGPMYTVHPHGGYSLLRSRWTFFRSQTGSLPLSVSQPPRAEFRVIVSPTASIKAACCCWAKAREDATTCSTGTGKTWRPCARTRSSSTSNRGIPTFTSTRSTTFTTIPPNDSRPRSSTVCGRVPG